MIPCLANVVCIPLLLLAWPLGFFKTSFLILRRFGILSIRIVLRLLVANFLSAILQVIKVWVKQNIHWCKLLKSLNEKQTHDVIASARNDSIIRKFQNFHIEKVCTHFKSKYPCLDILIHCKFLISNPNQRLIKTSKTTFDYDNAKPD